MTSKQALTALVYLARLTEQTAPVSPKNWRTLGVGAMQMVLYASKMGSQLNTIGNEIPTNRNSADTNFSPHFSPGGVGHW